MNSEKNTQGSDNFTFTQDQKEVVAEYYGENLEDLEEHEICELLDKLIDEAVLIKLKH